MALGSVWLSARTYPHAPLIKSQPAGAGPGETFTSERMSRSLQMTTTKPSCQTLFSKVKYGAVYAQMGECQRGSEIRLQNVKEGSNALVQ